MKMLLAVSALAASMLPVAPAYPSPPSGGPCVHDHLWREHPTPHGGSPHVHYPQCHDNSPERPKAKGHQHRKKKQQRTTDQYLGGCGFAAVEDVVAEQGQMTGEIDVEAVVYSAANPAGNPVSATFTCYVLVNGAPQPGAVVTASGTGVVIGSGVITYTSNFVEDFVQLCEDVSYSNGESTSECFEADAFEIPPPVVWDLIDG